MFISFAQNKIRYEKGQVFPFLIAVIAVVVILLMITVNLGQIAVFKTDVSNSADAAALAAAGTLSGTLLGFGLKSDMMCAEALVYVVAIYYAFIAIPCPWDFLTVAGLAAANIVKQSLNSKMAKWDGMMAWSNAKRNALQYTFNNAAVDEPRPTYKEFLNNAPGGSYDEYLKGETDNARKFARSGFSKFMDDSKKGYWNEAKFKKINPGIKSPADITQGYGWTQKSDGAFINSFEEKKSWKAYDNYVEVTVNGRQQYFTLGYYNFPGQGAAAVVIGGLVALESYPKYLAQYAYLGPFAPIVALALSIAAGAVTGVLVEFNNYGLSMDEIQEVDNAFIKVTVKRYKRPVNLGLWNFRYSAGNAPVQAEARAHAFRERGKETIDPTLSNGSPFLAQLLLVIHLGVGLTYFALNFDKVFDTTRHLFETEIKDVH